MKFLITLVFLTTLASCGLALEKQIKSLSIDPLARSYVNEFESEPYFGRSIDDLELRFAKINSPNKGTSIAGYCQKSTTYSQGLLETKVIKTPRIVINIDYWNTAEDYLKRKLIYHELGHCILNKGHIDNSAEIMYPYIGHSSKTWQNEVAFLFKGISIETSIAMNSIISNESVDVTINEEGEEVHSVPELHDCTLNNGIKHNTTKEYDDENEIHSHED